MPRAARAGSPAPACSHGPSSFIVTPKSRLRRGVPSRLVAQVGEPTRAFNCAVSADLDHRSVTNHKRKQHSLSIQRTDHGVVVKRPDSGVEHAQGHVARLLDAAGHGGAGTPTHCPAFPRGAPITALSSALRGQLARLDGSIGRSRQGVGRWDASIDSSRAMIVVDLTAQQSGSVRSLFSGRYRCPHKRFNSARAAAVEARCS